MKKNLKIRDLTLRDGQQSQFATRMSQDQVDRVLDNYKDAGFYAMEVWGGAVPDSVMRYLGEDPWERLEKIKKGVGDSSLLTALSRGRNLFGYNPYPDGPIEGFCRNSINSGIDIMRIFDALNDIDNMVSTIKYVHENRGLADCAVCYTVDPRWTLKEKLGFLARFRPMPKKVFTIDYFVKKARELEALGADIITVKDMAGLIDPQTTAKLIRRLKNEVGLPVNIHTHCTPGYGLASVLTAIVNGVDIVDTVIWNFAGGTAAPAFELVQLFASKLGIATGVNLQAVGRINRELKKIRQELADFDKEKIFPRDFEMAEDSLDPAIDSLFDQAIEAAQKMRWKELVKSTQAIEKHFNFPAPDLVVKKAQIPGGMYSNMFSQLQALKLDRLFAEVLKTVPRVRWDAGCPPLVTPTSQIVGVQAVNCVIDSSKKQSFYTNKSTQFVNLVKGKYGRTPVKIKPGFRQLVTGDSREKPFTESDYRAPENEILKDFNKVRLAQNEKEKLLLELFPNVAAPFLKKRRAGEFAEWRADNPVREKDAEDEAIDLLIGYSR